MAIHAVEYPGLQVVFFFLGQRGVAVVVFFNAAVISCDSDKGYFLSVVVARHIFYLSGLKHVVVNPVAEVGSFLAAYFHEKPDVVRGVFLISKMIIFDCFPVTDKSAGPVTLFTRVPGRPEVGDRRWNRSWEAVLDNRQHLSDAGSLGAYIPSGARADMAFHAFDPCVWRVLVGCPFGIHDHVAKVAAKISIFRQMISFVGADASAKSDQDAAEDK